MIYASKTYWECFLICSIWFLLGSLEHAMLTERGSAHITLSLHNTCLANSTFHATQERKPVLKISQKASFPSSTGSPISDLLMASSHRYRERSSVNHLCPKFHTLLITDTYAILDAKEKRLWTLVIAKENKNLLKDIQS